MTTAVHVFGFLLCILSGARTAHGLRDSSFFKDTVRHERHSDAAASELSALTGDAETANSGTCTIAARLEVGFARKGNAFRVTHTPDAVTCASLCADTVKDCVAINYRQSDRTCFFLANPGYVYASHGHTGALVNPSADDICSSTNMILGQDRYGGNISGAHYNLSSATACCTLCYSTKGCDAFAYVTGFRGCYLKQGAPALRTNNLCTSGLLCVPANA